MDEADNIGKAEHPRRIVFKLDNGNIAAILTRKPSRNRSTADM